MNITLGATPFAVSTLTGLTTAGAPGASFADVFSNAVNQVESAQQTARTAATEFLSSGKGDIHSIALDAQRAELSLELFQQVRNKFVSAYQEIMKMPM